MSDFLTLRKFCLVLKRVKMVRPKFVPELRTLITSSSRSSGVSPRNTWRRNGTIVSR